MNNIENTNKSSPDHESSRGTLFFRSLGRYLLGREPRYTEKERISLALGGAWVGETTWFIPGTANHPVSSLPDGFPIGELQPECVRAALDLKLISRAAITQDAYNTSQSVPESQLRAGALQLLDTIDRYNQES